MYIIIKKDKAEHYSEKLHKIKEAVCEVLEGLEEARERTIDREDVYGYEMSRRGIRREHERYEDNDDYYERDMARGRGRGRGRY